MASGVLKSQVFSKKLSRKTLEIKRLGGGGVCIPKSYKHCFVVSKIFFKCYNDLLKIAAPL